MFAGDGKVSIPETPFPAMAALSSTHATRQLSFHVRRLVVLIRDPGGVGPLVAGVRICSV